MTSSPRQPRWDPDPRGVGVGDATAHLATLDALRDAAAQAGWVAEEPEAHLLPHFRTAVAAADATLAIDAATTDPDGTFVLDTHWVGDAAADRGPVRVAALALIAAVTETVTLIHEPPAEAGVAVFEVVTGVLPGTSRFATHGHTLRLRVRAPQTAR